MLSPLAGLVSAFPMFGSSFFYIQSCSNNMVISPCILAINQNGLNFLNKETHVCMSGMKSANISIYFVMGWISQGHPKATLHVTSAFLM